MVRTAVVATALIALLVFAVLVLTEPEPRPPRMPPRNVWLADGASVRASAVAVKNERGTAVVIASGEDGIRKIASGDAADTVSLLPMRGASATLVDSDGFHYTATGLSIVKSSDDNDPRKPLCVVRIRHFATMLPREFEAGPIQDMAMTHDGRLAVAAPGGIFLVSRDLELHAALPLSDTAVRGLSTSHDGIYVATSRHVLRVAWTGTKLSFDESGGGWCAPVASGTAPMLLGFDADDDRLIVVAHGAEIVALWRDDIAHESRVADRIHADISPNVMSVRGDDVLLLNGAGAQKLVWNRRKNAFEKSWISDELRGTAAIANANPLGYVAGNGVLLAFDWRTGSVMTRWTYGPDLHAAEIALLDDGDLLLASPDSVHRIEAGPAVVAARQ